MAEQVSKPEQKRRIETIAAELHKALKQVEEFQASDEVGGRASFDFARRINQIVDSPPEFDSDDTRSVLAKLAADMRATAESLCGETSSAAARQAAAALNRAADICRDVS
jgi:hypothetical protein